MIEAKNLCFAHGKRPALHDVSAAFQPGKLSVILGPNGAGKSTLLGCLAGLFKPASGMALLEAQAITAMRAEDRAMAIGLLPQGAETHWALEAQALVALGRYPHRRGLGLSDEDQRAVAKAMNATATEQFTGRPVTALSGGERARILLARVLAGEPRWILADEPLANLDPGYQLDVLALLRSQAEIGRGVIAVLHDLHHAVRFADHVVLMHEGRVFAQGDVQSVINVHNLSKVYGIDATVCRDEKGEVNLIIKGKT